MDPIETFCPFCEAWAGLPCLDVFIVPATGARWTVQRTDSYHQERIDHAAEEELERDAARGGE